MAVALMFISISIDFRTNIGRSMGGVATCIRAARCRRLYGQWSHRWHMRGEC